MARRRCCSPPAIAKRRGHGPAGQRPLPLPAARCHGRRSPSDGKVHRWRFATDRRLNSSPIRHLDLALEVDADFGDMFAVRGYRRGTAAVVSAARPRWPDARGDGRRRRRTRDAGLDHPASERRGQPDAALRSRAGAQERFVLETAIPTRTASSSSRAAARRSTMPSSGCGIAMPPSSVAPRTSPRPTHGSTTCSCAARSTCGR